MPVVSFVLVVAVAMACAVWSPLFGYGLPWANPAWDEVEYVLDFLPGPDLPRALRQYDGPDSDEWLSSGFGYSFYIIYPDGWGKHVDGPPRARPSVAVGRAGLPFRCVPTPVNSHICTWRKRSRYES